MAQIQFLKSASQILTPATPEASEFLQRIKTGEWVSAEFRRVRNYQFHKRFFKLLQLGFDYWTPAGGALTAGELELVDRFVSYQIKMAGNAHGATLRAFADEFILLEGQLRTREVALLKSFEPYREWVTVQAGYYDDVILPDGTRRRLAKSISFARMDEDTFQAFYKAAFNVLWNHILFRKFRSQQEAESVAMQLLEFAS
ncbi:MULTISPECIES: DUF1367 family protein [unclassified Pantoea]|uniref:DUF1367 family protein n=1 Tax=unclassified Pantoea TaxID=2630326 RepID=UPI0020534BFA|nr:MULTISPECIES: DUF1367 family protein [unclassified Pantoea]MDU5473996.1 DUF1367 family protein [Pantoea sp.]DAI70351.1 MAG TPA: Protein of unknown function (DUF1367) [Bacteriophage sp.]